jgi:hypothetical protein
LISNVEHLKNRWVTVTAYIKLDATGTTEPEILLKQTGSSPSGDVAVAVKANPEEWVRVVLQAFVDNDTTALEIQFFPDGQGVKVSSVVANIDGVQLTTGLEVRGFEYPPPVKIDATGKASVTDLDVLDALVVFGDANVQGNLDVDTDLNVDGNAQIDGNLTIDGILFSSGGADVIAFLAL